jgi:hypothetical protein
LKTLTTFTNLWFLNLSGTKVSDACLQHLASLKQLRQLEIRETRLTSEGLKWLSELPDLVQLDTRGSTIRSDALDQFAASVQRARGDNLSLEITKALGAGNHTTPIPIDRWANQYFDPESDDRDGRNGFEGLHSRTNTFLGIPFLIGDKSSAGRLRQPRFASGARVSTQP